MSERYKQTSVLPDAPKLGLSGMGVDLCASDIHGVGRLVLILLSSLSPTLRKSFLFGASPWHSLAQKAVQRFLGLQGPGIAHIQYMRGPLKGNFFECFTSEKYFLLGPEYEADLQDTVRPLLKLGDVVYDIGANTGFWSLLFSVFVGSSGQVYAFEPSPTNVLRFERNIQRNQKGNVLLTQRAVSDTEGIVLFSDDGSTSHIVESSLSRSDGCVQVDTITLDNFVYRDLNAQPALIKIDIEGNAGRCLKGAERVLTDARPYVLCEVHDPSELSQVLTVLAQLSYEIERLDAPYVYPEHILASPSPRLLKAD
jgi:FkbM family methyltransferase